MIRATTRVRTVVRAAASIVALVGSACSTTIQGGAAADAPRIAGVSVSGNDEVDEDDITEGLANRGPEGILRRTYRRLDRLALEQDISRIESYYHRRGFFSAKVVGTDVKPDGDRAVRVTFRVIEGQPTRVAGLSLIGLSELLRRSKMLDLQEGPLLPGAIFRHDRYIEFKAWLQSWMAHRGYPHARVDGRVDIDRDAHTADVRVTIDDGPLVRFGQTEVRGLERVPESAVRNRLAWKPGERFDPELLELTQGRLYQLGLFGSIRMDYDKENRPRTSDVRIGLTEASRRELRLGGGLAVEGGFTPQDLRVEVRERTDFILRGALDPLTVLRLEARPAWQWNLKDNQNAPAGEATAALDRPDLFLPRTVGTAMVGYQREQLEAYGTKGPVLRLGLNRPFFSDQLSVQLAWRFRRLYFFGLEDGALDGELPPHFTDTGEPVASDRVPDPDEQEVQDQLSIAVPYRLGVFEQTVSFDRRDQPLDARRGVFAALSLTEGGAAAGGAIRFARATAEARGYLPLGRRLVLAGRGLYGRRLGSELLPLTERFFEGGASGHRGFLFRRLAPYVDTPYTPYIPPDPENGMPEPTMGEPTVQKAPVGGDESFLGTGEVRLDIGHLLSYPFGVVGFVDAGDVICDLPQCSGKRSLDFSNLHWATGAGVRWTPVISVRFDLGYRLNRTGPAEPEPAATWYNRLAFHVSLGQAF
jgi:translocation and assembly module TamA